MKSNVDIKDIKNAKRKIYKRTHPYTILSSLYRFAFLLIIPVLQSLLFNSTNIIDTITSLGFNILFIVLLILIAFLSYKKTFYNLSNKKLSIKKGFIITSTNFIPYKNITSIFVQKNILPAMFNCVKIYIDTAGAKTRKSDFYILLTFNKASNLVKSIFNVKNNDYIYKYKSSIWRIFLMGLTWSNSITGLLLFAPFVKNSGVILGQEYSNRLYEGVNIAVYIASIGLPPATAYIAGILVFGYAVALIVQIFRYGRFSFEINENILRIKRGLVDRAIFTTNINHINSISINQSFLMILLKLKSVYINTIGLGKTKGDKRLLSPVERTTKAEEILSQIIDIKGKIEKEIRPQSNRIISYLLSPFIGLLLNFPVYYILKQIGITSDILELSITLSLLLMSLWLIFRFIAYKKSKIVKYEKGYVAVEFKRMNIIENRITKEKVQQIEIRQSLIQQKYKSCHVIIYVYGEKKTKHVIRHLEYKDAICLIE